MDHWQCHWYQWYRTVAPCYAIAAMVPYHSKGLADSQPRKSHLRLCLLRLLRPLPLLLLSRLRLRPLQLLRPP